VTQYGNLLLSRGEPYITQYVPVPTQSTTSFRSGGKFGGNEIDDPRQLFQEQAQRGLNSYDTGHTFSSTKQILLTSHRDVFLKSPTFPKAFYRGPLWVVRGTGSDTGFKSIPSINLDVFGTKAIAGTRPNKPTVSLSRGLAEILREGFPKLIGGVTYSSAVKKRDHLSAVQDGGGEYLNYVFGALPSAQLIKDLSAATLHAYPIIQQFLRDSERVVRRRLSFDPILSSSSSIMGLSYPFNIPDTGFGGWSDEHPTTTGLWTSDDSLRRDIWFSGAFQYFVTKSGKNPFDELERYRQLSRKLLDTEITIDTIYALTPWSWLIDWFVDFGDILGNVIAFQNDGLVLRYGYLMCQSIQDNVGRVGNVTISGNHYNEITTTYRVIRKERVKATPFGFGLNPSSFNAGQWSILAALGLTKGPNLLR